MIPPWMNETGLYNLWINFSDLFNKQCETEKKLEIQGLQRLLIKLNFPQPSKKMYQENIINLSATGSAATGQGNSANILLSCDREI